MAISGDGFALDKTFKLDDNLKTTTSQYKIVSMVAGTSANADLTVQQACATGTGGVPTAASRYAIGVLQTYQSAGSLIGSVRMFGIAKVKVAASVTAGEFLRAYDGAITTTAAGFAQPVANGLSVTAATMSVTAQNVILGRAMEDGSTGTVISIFLNPQLYDRNLIGA